MPPPKRVVPAKGRPEVREEEETSPLSSPRRDAYFPRGGRGRIESPTKSSPGASSRRPLTSEDVRADASPVFPQRRGRGRPPKITQVASKLIDDSDASNSRRSRSRRTTEQSGIEDMPTSSRSRMDSQSTIASRQSPPMTSPRRGRKKSEMESMDEPSERGAFDEGRGKRKRKLTEAAEASQAQSRSRKSSRRISERLEQHELHEMEQIHEEELTEPIEDEIIEGEEVLEEVAHEEMVHAVSPQDMYMQPHLSRPLHSSMGGARTRGMHVISDHDHMLDQQLVEEEEEHAIEEMVVYDDEGNMLMGYEGEEMAHEEIIEGVDEEELMRHHVQPHHDPRRRHIMQPHEMKEEAHEQDGQEGDDDEEDQPPQLEPEEGPGPEEIMMREDMERGQMQQMVSYEEQERYVRSPGGTTYYQDPADEDDMYVDGLDQGMMQMVDGDPAPVSSDLRTVEFNFLDNKHICCGMCGEIVPYDNLLREHLPMHHPEVYGDMGTMDLEEISYDTWLKEKLNHERKTMENGFRSIGYADQQGTSSMSRTGRNTRVLRRVSQVRVNPSNMTLAQLDVALKKKMVEKMGRKVKVSLVDKQHARCGICNAVVSLNKKFEVVHLVRHFNAWHPSSHRCAGTWPDRAPLLGPGKPLSSQDFAVVDVALEAPESLQCIWCGMFMDRTMLAMHFHEVHPDDVEVPKCHLCLQEVVINARLLEKYGEDFEITLPDEHHIRCQKVQGSTFSTEAALDRCIDRRLRRMAAVENGEQEVNEEEDDADDEERADPSQPKDAQYSNSRMNFGRRNKPKRNFIMPSLRQAIPQDSRYVEALSEGQWRCKICKDLILAAVISAGAIKHYRTSHPEMLEDMQYELCKARLERVSDGCMEFVHPQLIECLICNLTYALHKPYNMCRGIRHLKTKHPEMMPEYNRNGEQATTMPVAKKDPQYKYEQQPPVTARVEMGEYVEDPEIINKLKQEYDIDFDKVQTMYGPDGRQFFVLVPTGQEVDAQVAENIQASVLEMSQQGEGEGEGEEEEGVIVEEEEYQMEDEIVVRDSDVRRVAAGRSRYQGVRRHQMRMVEDDEVQQHEGEEVHDEMGEELAEEELVEGQQGVRYHQ